MRRPRIAFRSPSAATDCRIESRTEARRREDRQAGMHPAGRRVRPRAPRHRPRPRRPGRRPHRPGRVLRREPRHRGHADPARRGVPPPGGEVDAGRVQADPGDGRRQDPQPARARPAGEAPRATRRGDGRLPQPRPRSRPGPGGRLLRARERRAARHLGRHRRAARPEGAVQRLLRAPGRAGADRVGEPAPGRAAGHHAGRAAALLRQRGGEEHRQLGPRRGDHHRALEPPGRGRAGRAAQRLPGDLRPQGVLRRGGGADRRRPRRPRSRDRPRRDEPGARPHELGRVLPDLAQAHLRGPPGRSRDRRSGGRVRAGHARRPADGRDQRLARAVRRPGRRVVPPFIPPSATSTGASARTRASSRPAG